jgi:hypothetical protein
MAEEESQKQSIVSITFSRSPLIKTYVYKMKRRKHKNALIARMQ